MTQTHTRRNRRLLWGLVSAVLAAALVWHAMRDAGHPVEPLADNVQVDHIVVYKAQRKLMLYGGARLVRSYDISLGKVPAGPKRMEGDRKTPEGRYTINDKNPHSQYHKNLGISYPGPHDLAAARQLGVAPGHSIKIHGLPNHMPDIGRLHLGTDWTDGCIAVTNQDIDEIYRVVAVGTPIDILP